MKFQHHKLRQWNLNNSQIKLEIQGDYPMWFISAKRIRSGLGSHAKCSWYASLTYWLVYSWQEWWLSPSYWAPECVRYVYVRKNLWLIHSVLQISLCHLIAQLYFIRLNSVIDEPLFFLETFCCFWGSESFVLILIFFFAFCGCTLLMPHLLVLF